MAICRGQDGPMKAAVDGGGLVDKAAQDIPSRAIMT
jgi:hypothetical protein